MMRNSKKILNNIQNIVEAAVNSKYSGFYRQKYGLKPNRRFLLTSWADFFSLPITTSEDLRIFPSEQRIFVPRSKINMVRYSSSTSGSSPIIVYSELKNTPQALADRRQRNHWLNKAERILLMRHPKAIPREYLFYKQYLKKTVLAGMLSNLTLSARLCQEVKINTLVASPKVAIKFYPLLAKFYKPRRIKYIRFFGDTINEIQAAALKRYYSRAVWASTYASTEAEVIASQCPYLAKNNSNFFHPHLSSFFYEILDRNYYRRVCALGEVGEITITSLKLKPLLLLRYGTGDLGRWVYEKGKCRCGKSAEYLQVFGPIQHSIITLGRFDFFRNSLEKEMSPFYRFLTGNFLIETYLQNNKTGLKFILEPEDNASRELAKQIKKTIMNAPLLYPKGTRSLEKASAIAIKETIKEGWLLPPQVALERPLADQRNKIYFIDKRNKKNER